MSRSDESESPSHSSALVAEGVSPARSPRRWVVAGACATAFVASGCVMTVELIAGRLIAPYLGSSLYTWTSVIGVVLGGLAIGNYIGGRLADRYATTPTLALLFILSSAGCLLTALINRWVGDWSALWFLGWSQRIAVHVFLAFAPSAAILGTIGPVVAKMALNEGRAVGRTVGSVYAWGAVGSIVGTFATGFYLVAIIGVLPILYIVAGVLACMAMFYAARYWLTYAWAACVVIFLVFTAAPSPRLNAMAAAVGLRDQVDPEVLFDRDSHYSHVRVAQSHDVPGLRVMLLDKLIHSQINMDRPRELIYGYERIYAAVTDHVAAGRQELSGLILGGGGYTHPRYFMQHRPASHLEVVEIDPVVTRAAMEAFGLPENPPFKIIHLDARQHLVDLTLRKRAGRPVPEFDLVFLDAVNDFNVPFHLTTLECQQLVDGLMSREGAYLTTLIDVLEVGKFLGSLLKTRMKTFEQVQCFFADDAGPTLDPRARNVFVVVASHRDLRLQDLSGSPYSDEVRGTLLSDEQVAALLDKAGDSLLTDSYAPVDYLLSGVVQQGGKDAHLRFYNRGNAASARGNLRAASRAYRRCIELQPGFHLAHLNLGNVLVEQGDLHGALQSFTRAVELRPDWPEARNNVGSVYLRLHDYQTAAVAFRRAVEIDPDYATGHSSLGMALANMGLMEEARSAFETALRLQPDHAAARRNLAILESAMQSSSTPGPSGEPPSPVVNP